MNDRAYLNVSGESLYTLYKAATATLFVFFAQVALRVDDGRVACEETCGINDNAIPFLVVFFYFEACYNRVGKVLSYRKRV